MRGLITVALCIALAGCGTGTSATNETNGGSAVDTTLTKLSLTSGAFQDGQIPRIAQFGRESQRGRRNEGDLLR